MHTSLTEMDEVATLALGNVQTFDFLYKKYRFMVYANILKVVKSPEHAEDVLQDVFVSLWENRNKFTYGQTIGGWLFVVSYNKALNFLQQRVKLSIDYIESYQSYEHIIPEDGLDESAYLTQIMMVEEAVEALPNRKREVFRLCRFEGKSKEEVASIMGISPSSVGDYLKQSNKAIKDYIVAHYPYGTAGTLVLSFFIC